MGSFGLEELVVEVEGEYEDCNDEELTGDLTSITVILEIPAAHAVPDRQISVEGLVLEFIDNNPKAAKMEVVLRDLATDFQQSGNKDTYFAAYTSLLSPTFCASFNCKATEVLQILNKFYHVLSPKESKCTNPFVQSSTLTDEDKRALQYIGGAILRRLFYHQATSRGEKILVEALAGEVEPGSIAFERNRERISGPAKPSLWGVSSPLQMLLEEGEMHFRAQHTPQLCITRQYFKQFLDAPSICRLNNWIAQLGETNLVIATAVTEKIIIKFTLCRARSYSTKLEKYLKKKGTSKRPKSANKGIRKTLKSH